MTDFTLMAIGEGREIEPTCTTYTTEDSSARERTIKHEYKLC